MMFSEINNGSVLVEGKTKVVKDIPAMPGRFLVGSKNVITAGDGLKQDVIEGKAVFSTMTTCNVFHLLKACGIPVAFQEQVSPSHFITDAKEMLPYEVVVRREAHGSFLNRYPHLSKGHVFPKLILEFFAKTSGKKWKGNTIPMDDPLIKFVGGDVEFYLPHFTQEQKEESVKTGCKGYLFGNKPFMTVHKWNFFTTDNEEKLLEQMGQIAKETFLILEKAWQLQGKRLVDFKVEFGLTDKGELRLADVINNDSWRLIGEDGSYEDKQVYRDGGNLNEVTRKYRQISELTNLFTIPKQQIIGWVGSEKDDKLFLHNTLADTGCWSFVKEKMIVYSAHKEPVKADALLRDSIQAIPDSVVVALIGMSNGAGPTLSANCIVPVITSPANAKEFPDDIWSSLRMPSSVPVMTVLNPKNAVLAGLQILAMRNPGIYAKLRLKQEERFVNVVNI